MRIQGQCGLALICLTFLLGLANANGSEGPVQLQVYPRAEPRPALSIPLLPPFAERVRGNAAIHYGKVAAGGGTIFGDGGLILKIDEWLELPQDELRKTEVNLPTERIEMRLRRAALCASCDWELPVREQTYYLILLNELQELRNFARILALRARLQILEGDLQAAITTLQTGFALARHAAAGETIINGLVGASIVRMMSVPLFELVQHPDAPSMYWAVSMLPRPLIDLREGVEGELFAMQTLPVVDRMGGIQTEEQWEAALRDFWKEVYSIFEGIEPSEEGSPESQLAVSLAQLDFAKRVLLASGMEPATVDKMSNAEIVFKGTLQTFEEVRDNVLKWWFAYPAGSEMVGQKMTAASQLSEEQKRLLGPLVDLTTHMNIGLGTTSANTQRTIAVLQIVEAIRIYAAENESRLPTALADITSVPIPADPYSGQPFAYKVDGEVATLSMSPLTGYPSVYEIRLGKPVSTSRGG